MPELPLDRDDPLANPQRDSLRSSGSIQLSEYRADVKLDGMF